jgi:predicted nucleic acid-binding protein
MSFRVVLDACVLVPSLLCDVLLHLAEDDLYNPLWSAEILDETQRALVGKLGVDPERAQRRLGQMRRAFPSAEVDDYESLIPAMTHDPKDRHVLAAAVRGNADLIVTANIKDFPASALDMYGLSAVHPDDFLLDQLDLDTVATVRALRRARTGYRRPTMTGERFYSALTRMTPLFAARAAAADLGATPSASDQPPGQWRRFLRPDEAPAVLPPEDLTNPASVGLLFCQALADHRRYRPALGFLVTPESSPHWGDFSQAAAFLAEIEDHAYGSFTNPAHGAPDVQYFKILRHVSESYQLLDDQIVGAAAVLTLIWRPEHGRWMVHSIGEFALPEQLPRSAPGQLPPGMTT